MPDVSGLAAVELRGKSTAGTWVSEIANEVALRDVRVVLGGVLSAQNSSHPLSRGNERDRRVYNDNGDDASSYSFAAFRMAKAA